MQAAQHDTWSLDEEEVVTASLEEAQAHDAYWREAHAQENYFRPGLDYEDYAPAYCVGYVGQTQYRGGFEDAEKSLVSNWVRIKGDSRLSMDEAMMAIRAAWDRAAVPAAQRTPLRAHAAAPSAVKRFIGGVGEWLGDVFGEPAARPLARRPQHGSVPRP